MPTAPINYAAPAFDTPDSMTIGQALSIYRHAQDLTESIAILADCNLVSRKIVREFLARHGKPLPATSEPSPFARGPNALVPASYRADRVRELAEQGLCAAEIAGALAIPQKAVYNAARAQRIRLARPIHYRRRLAAATQAGVQTS